MDARAEQHLTRAKEWKLWADQHCTPTQREIFLKLAKEHEQIAQAGCVSCLTPWVHEEKGRKFVPKKG